jgi:hypothetical protein
MAAPWAVVDVVAVALMRRERADFPWAAAFGLQLLAHAHSSPAIE